MPAINCSYTTQCFEYKTDRCDSCRQNPSHTKRLYYPYWYPTPDADTVIKSITVQTVADAILTKQQSYYVPW